MTGTTDLLDPVNGNKGYEWNVTVPDMAGTQSILKIKDGVIYARATYTDGAPGTTKVGDVAYDISSDTIKKDANGQIPHLNQQHVGTSKPHIRRHNTQRLHR